MALMITDSPIPEQVAESSPAHSSAGESAATGAAKVNIQINLRKVPLFADLTEKEMAQVKADLRIRQFARRDIVLQKVASGDSLLFLLSGQLQVVDVTEDGRTIGLRILVPGDFFGEIAVLTGASRTASVVAMSSVLVAFLPQTTALHLFANSPSVSMLMLRHLADRIRRDTEYRALLSINNTSRRVYNFLLLFKQNSPGNSDVVANLPTHQDIAIMINTSRETVTRAILALIQQGVVEKDVQHRLIIRKPDLMLKLAQGAA